MLGLNKTSTEYTIKVLLYKAVSTNKGIQLFSETPETIYCNYTSSSDISRLNLNQGVSATAVFIETDTNKELKNNDKLVLNGQQLYIKNIRTENNPLSGGRFTNKPASVVKYISAD